MKVRYKWPGGTGIITLGDDATLADVVQELASKTSLSNFGIKFGQPTAMKTLDMSDLDQLAKKLGLHGETLTIVPHDARSSPTKQFAGETGILEPEIHRRQTLMPQDVHVPWEVRDGTLLLRVMPSDNSCLFTAFGGALPQQVLPSKLRQMMSDYIQEHVDVYSEAILGVPPDKYCRSIVDPDRWGGGIELSILSSIFDIKIWTFDNPISFGEGKRDQCILVYSGVHYDRIAFSYSEYPHTAPMLPIEMDRTVWPIEDEEVLIKAQELVGKLHGAHYYTNMDGLLLKCDIADCAWIGSGQAEGQRHAAETGHAQLSEIVDKQTDAVLRHESYSVIEDW
ncbi:OTU-like cysteine protease [Beauveria bassiana ARSEF 2860]|uniref:Ubiquitin thioesterase OTU n=1 Tax=Beauveria bassiana (strain ARSEF 2860) TaxID=655819 RepID=J4UIE6_BEAB2|nr:OTU-like cysteine protease [Beauveria bassiana ARSEF 2860]EJP63257.1 OTU-like cysteine protease [Beauveria bassiana ARSEF 2860]